MCPTVINLSIILTMYCSQRFAPHPCTCTVHNGEIYDECTGTAHIQRPRMQCLPTKQTHVHDVPHCCIEVRTGTLCSFCGRHSEPLSRWGYACALCEHSSELDLEVELLLHQKLNMKQILFPHDTTTFSASVSIYRSSLSTTLPTLHIAIKINAF